MPRLSAPDAPFNPQFQHGVVALAVLLFAAMLYWSLRAVFLYTIDLGGIEENVVYGIQKLLMGLPLYTDPARPTFDVVQYTPLYFYLAAGIGHLAGLDPEQPQQVFVLSRLVALACNLGTVCVLFRILRRMAVAQWLALFWSLLLFATLTRHFYSRPDALYLLLFAASMGLFLRSLRTEADRRLLALATAFACLSVLAKQTGVLPLCIIGLHLLWQRRWRDLFTQVAIAAVLLGIAFGSLCLHYGGFILYQNIVTGVKNGFSWEIFRTVFGTRRYLTIVGFHVLGGVLAWRMLRGIDPVRRALGLGIVVTFVFALVTGLKSGSRLNYFLENFLLIFLALPLLFTAQQRPLLRYGQLALLAYAFLHFSLGVLRLRALVNGTEAKEHGREHYAQATALVAHLRDDLHLRPGQYVLIQGRDFLEHFLVGHGVLDQKDIIYYSSSRLYDYSRFFAAMDDGSVCFVVSRKPLAWITLLGRTFTGFVPVDTLEGHVLYTHAAAGLR